MPSSPLPNFDRIARLYRWAEYLTLGPLLQQTRTALLDRLSGSRQALLFGDGDGRFLARLLTCYPTLQATAVDTSAAMLRLLQARCRHASPRLTTTQGSALSVPIPPARDLIVTHFFLDCLSQDEVDRLARRLAAAVQPGTLWLLSDFEVPTTPVLKSAARLYIRSLYLAFGLLTGLRVRHLPDPQAALAAAGFRRLLRRRKLFGLLYSELWLLDPPAASDQPRPRHNPPVPTLIHTPMVSTPEDNNPNTPSFPTDAQPDPEPAPPSLDRPDPGVFHHDPAPLPSSKPN